MVNLFHARGILRGAQIKKRLWVLITASAIVTHSAFVHAELVGTAPGDFSVSDNGAAVYEIPISMPAGSGGTRPDLSIVYNSQEGTGVAGERFSGGQLQITMMEKLRLAGYVTTHGRLPPGNRILR